MKALARLTRGLICKSSPGISRLSQGYLCSSITDVILPFKLCSVTLPTRGIVHLQTPAVTRSTWGVLCIPRTSVIIPPGFIPTFLIPEQVAGEEVLFNKTTNISDADFTLQLVTPTLPVLTSPALNFKINKDADIYNKEIKIINSNTPVLKKTDETDIYNKEDPDLIDDP